MFYNREQELEILRNRYEKMRKGEMIILYGRRRIGKTSLVKKFLDGIETRVYSFIDYSEKTDILDRISKDFSMQMDTFLRFGDWDHIYEYLSKIGGKIVVVFDEFQRLESVAPSGITRLQHYWDSKLNEKRVMLILVGSSIGMMKKVAISGGAPLYGRSTMVYKISPFKYSDMRKMFSDESEEDIVKIYTVFGGTPYYQSIFKDKNIRLFDGIEEIILRAGAQLREEPSNILRMELKEVSRYNSILSSIARGKQTITEISDAAGIEATNLRYYIENLKELLDIVGVRYPLLGKKKTTQYIIKDNFFKFWFKYVFPNHAALEMENYGYVMEKIKQGINSDIGFVFEDIVRELLSLYSRKAIEDYLLNITQIGSWWNRKGDEIDIVALNGEDLIVGEVKWGRIDIGVVESLIEKSKLINWKKNKKFLVVSRAGFTKRCERFMDENDIISLNMRDIKALFDEAAHPS